MTPFVTSFSKLNNQKLGLKVKLFIATEALDAFEQIHSIVVLPPFQKKIYPVDFDDELKIGDVRYDDMT